MIIDYVIFGTAVLGSSVAAAYDLKTTEVPNNVFYAMLIVGIPAVLIKTAMSGGIGPLEISGLTGLGLFGLGYLMYRVGQWGGADMVLLALIGFLMPSLDLGIPWNISFPFGVSFLINLFMIGAVYMIAYSIVFAMRNGRILRRFVESVRASSKALVVISASMAVLFTGLVVYLDSLIGEPLTASDLLRTVALPVALTVSFMLVYKFAKAVENFGFKTRIPVSRLRVGDMLMSERKLVGISKEQISRIRRSGARSVWIKEGVRFAPAFPMALLFTVFVGDAIMLIKLFF